MRFACRVIRAKHQLSVIVFNTYSLTHDLFLLSLCNKPYGQTYENGGITQRHNLSLRSRYTRKEGYKRMNDVWFIALFSIYVQREGHLFGK
jgi:hypothetical protein